MYGLYKFAISLYFNAISLAALFRKDARKWIAGRKDWHVELKSFIDSIPNKKKIWMHVASLGEYEQGRELITLIRKHQTDTIIILSFFSPSGYDKCKSKSEAHWVCYFPSDKMDDVNLFLNILNPSLAIFVKYDFWFNTLHALHHRNIPYCFISLILRPGHYLLNPLFRSLLIKLKHARQLFLQNAQSYELLLKHGFDNMQVCGDTRLDRVYHIAQESTEINAVKQFCRDSRVFVAGSIWKEDITVIAIAIHYAINNNWKIILVPHAIDELTLQYLEKTFQNKTFRFSQNVIQQDKPVMIMDQIGYLSKLYRYCNLAFIGGGFGKGIHNILEPAAHKKFVCFGPRYHKFQEAHDFIKTGIAQVIHNAEDLIMIIDYIKEDKINATPKIENYFQKNLGASQKIFQYLMQQELV